VSEATVKRLLCFGFWCTGKAMGQVYQCWWRICGEINVFSRFRYHMFYILYPFVTYLLTLPHKWTLIHPTQFTLKIRQHGLWKWFALPDMYYLNITLLVGGTWHCRNFLINWTYNTCFVIYISETEFLFQSWFCYRHVGVPHQEKVTLFNVNNNKTIHMSSISGSTVHFHSSFFEDKVRP
jgi:hypothetical protein